MLHAIAALLLARAAHASTATATFDAAKSGVAGTVVLEEGAITLTLDLTAVNTSVLPSDCLDDGLKYHLHMLWTHGDMDDRIGSTACSGTYTGGHYDPYAACAGPSGNTACDAGCLNLTGSAYSCGFDSDVYTCEIGDWSGKYGKFTWDATSKAGTQTHSSFYEITANAVDGMSVVFHCGVGGQRAICAPFVLDPANAASNDNMVDQSATASVVTATAQTSTFSFKEQGGLFAYDKSDWTSTVPSGCTGGLKAWVYEQWTDTSATELLGAACTEAVVGKVWDATNACPPNSNNDNCVNGNLCDDAGFAYTCSAASNYYGCSPADVLGSAALAAIPIAAGDGSGRQFNMYPLDGLVGKALVLTCDNDGSIAACAKLQDASPPGTTAGTTDDDDGSGVASVGGLLAAAVVGALVFAA